MVTSATRTLLLVHLCAGAAYVATALSLLSRVGLPDLTMRAIGTELGVQQSALYHHFGDKKGLLLAVIVAGYLISTADGEPISVFGWFSVPATLSGLPDQADVAGEIHLYLAWALVVFAVLHALAALKHHFVDRDPTLKRMLGRSSNDQQPR